MEDSYNIKIDNKKIGKATIWSFAAEAAAKLIVPITNMILARIIAPEAFGIIATLNIVISFAEVFSTSGFQKYIVQETFNSNEELEKASSVAFWTNILFSVLIWSVIFAFNVNIASLVGSEGYGFALVIASLSLPLQALSSIHEALFLRKLEYRVLFIRRLIVSFVPLLVTVPLALIGLNYWALIIGTLAGNLTKFVLMLFFTKWRPSFFYSFSILKQMFSFCSWTLLESIAFWACSYIDVLIISNSLGDYYTGLYKNSQSTVTGILSIITASTTSVIFASLCRAKDDDRQFKGILYNFQKYVSIVVLPLGVGIFVFKDLITYILLGSSWMEGSTFVGVWGLCTSLVAIFGTFSREVYRAKGKPYISFFVQLLHLLFVIPVCLFSVKKGFEFLSISRSLASLEIIVIHMFMMKIIFKFSPLKMFLSVKEPILCSVVMGLLGYFLLKISNGIVIQFAYVLICVIVYFGTLIIFKEYRRLIVSYLTKIIKKKN